MKIYDENKNYVGEIERPEPIEQDGKWWEFLEYRAVKIGEKSVCNDGVQLCDSDGFLGLARWIASEIPRATPEQLKAIGMRERDGRPVKCISTDKIWYEGSKGAFYPNDSEIGSYRFVLVPDVQKEKPCSTCSKINCHFNAEERYDLRITGCEKGWTPLLTKTVAVEPRFSVEETYQWVLFCSRQGLEPFCVIKDQINGLAAFTERRRNAGKM